MWRYVLCQYSLTVFVSVRVFNFFLFVCFFLSVRVPLCVSAVNDTTGEKGKKCPAISDNSPNPCVSLQSLYFPIYSFKIKNKPSVHPNTQFNTLEVRDWETCTSFSYVVLCLCVFTLSVAFFAHAYVPVLV